MGQARMYLIVYTAVVQSIPYKDFSGSALYLIRREGQSPRRLDEFRTMPRLVLIEFEVCTVAHMTSAVVLLSWKRSRK